MLTKCGSTSENRSSGHGMLLFAGWRGVVAVFGWWWNVYAMGSATGTEEEESLPKDEQDAAVSARSLLLTVLTLTMFLVSLPACDTLSWWCSHSSCDFEGDFTLSMDERVGL